MDDGSDARTIADGLLRSWCLTWDDDDSVDHEAPTNSLLPNSRAVTGESLAAAAVLGDIRTVEEWARSGRSVDEPEPPYEWTPLMYLSYARPPDAISATDLLAVLDVLLEAGANPNEARNVRGLPTAFTVLTGAFGDDTAQRPLHPACPAFAERLLKAGADPNDEQLLYNRMFSDNDDFLQLLMQYGLRTDVDSSLVAPLMLWAALHDQADRLALLAAGGADLNRPLSAPWLPGEGRTALEWSITAGAKRAAALLPSLDADAPTLTAVDRYAGWVLGTIDEPSSDSVALARRERPGLIVWASDLGDPDAVRRLVADGFDVDTLARADVPSEQAWQTALHTAAGSGDEAVVRLLLEAGANRSIRDARFDATPAEWASFFNHHAVAELIGGRNG